MSIYNAMRDRWMLAGVRANKPADSAAVSRLEAKVGLVLPDDFKEYLTAVNGMEDGQVDEYFIAFHSLQTIESHRHRNWASLHVTDVVIADYSLDAHLYLLSFSASAEMPIVVVTDGVKTVELAKSFADFVRLYLSSPNLIVNCWS